MFAALVELADDLHTLRDVLGLLGVLRGGVGGPVAGRGRCPGHRHVEGGDADLPAGAAGAAGAARSVSARLGRLGRRLGEGDAAPRRPTGRRWRRRRHRFRARRRRRRRQ